MNKFHSLVSSSSGNSYVYQIGAVNILVDLGASCKQITTRLEELGIKKLDAILITHEHTDHIKGLEVFLKKQAVDVYMTKASYQELKFTIDDVKFITPWEKFEIGDCVVDVLKTSHDSMASVGFMFNDSIVHLTDTGYLSSKLLEVIDNKQTYVIESNYEDEMIMANENYPFFTKQRIMSDKGHLSNFDCAKYLRGIVGSATDNVFFAHLSKQNNKPELVLEYNQKLSVKTMAVLPSDDVTSYNL